MHLIIMTRWYGNKQAHQQSTLQLGKKIGKLFPLFCVALRIRLSLSSIIVTKSPKNVLKTKISPIILSSAINLSKRNVKQQQLHKQEIGRRRRRRRGQQERKENAVENCSLKYSTTLQKMSLVCQIYFYFTVPPSLIL